MKDRYLFRGKTGSGNWVEGFLSASADRKKFYISNKAGSPFAYEIMTETICQCTGIRDMNGNPIYENDILSGYLDDDFPDDETRTRVVWHENGWCTNQHGCVDFEKLDDWDSEHFEVIGNVVDNPKLLEV